MAGQGLSSVEPIHRSRRGSHGRLKPPRRVPPAHAGTTARGETSTGGSRMHHPTIFFDPAFVVNVIAGWLLTVAGAGALLLAAIWSVAADEWLPGEPKPAA